MEKLSTKAKSYIRNHIRQAWRYYSAYRQVVKKNTRNCGICGKEVTNKRDIHVDHIKPVGKFKVEDQPYVVKMFTDLDNLQGTHRACNSKKRDK